MVGYRSAVLLALGCCLAAPLHLSALPPEAPLLPTEVGQTVLLLDDYTVAQTKGLTQRFFSAKKHPGNPVLQQTEPWEGTGPFTFGTRLLQDEKTGEFRVWYCGFEPGTNKYRWGMATSRDGITWTKPDLGLAKFNEGPGRNLLTRGGSYLRDPRPETPAERRYVSVQFTYGGEIVAFSPDGLRWTEYAGNPVWHVPSDCINVLWDERRNCFVGYYKLWEIVGTEITPSGEERPFIAHASTFTPTPLAENKTSFAAPLIRFRKDGAAEVKKDQTFVLRAENQGADDGGGGVALSGAWTSKRVQAWARSDDGIHWTDEQVILRADEKDTPSSNIQCQFVIRYGGYYIGFLTMHDEAGFFRLQLAHSSDGVKWHRPWRESWLDVSSDPDAFDRAMILGPVDPIIGEREMSFLYGGFPLTHDKNGAAGWKSAIGIATTRLDGFAAWRGGADGGELVTQPLRCTGDRLFVNADAPRGSVTVEVLGEDGNPLPGFEAAACRSLHGDTLAEGQNGWVTWEKNQDLKDLQGKTIRLRFVVKDADLFSFRIADEKTANMPTPRATNR